MAFYIVTGKLGSGKSLCAVGRIQEYLQQGRRVATNLDLNIEFLLKPGKKFDVVRVPDRPMVEDMEYLGMGYEGDYDEDRFGLLVLDEAGKWLNTRSFSEKGRKEFISWLIHSRKWGWDVLLLVQDIEALDKQVRDMFCEHLVICQRLDRMPISVTKLLMPAVIMTAVFVYAWGIKAVLLPALIGFAFFAFTSGRIPMPRVHIAKVHYGDKETDPVVDRWLYRGGELIKAYDTRQKFYDRDTPLASGLSHFVQPPLKPVTSVRINWLAVGAVFSVACFAVAFFLSQTPIAEAAPVQTVPETQVQVVEQPEPFAVRIAGSFAMADGTFHYFFARGSQSVSSAEVRQWRVKPFHACAAAVTVDGVTHQVSCQYADAMPTPISEKP